MKFWASFSGALTTLLVTTPAWAQASDQTVEQGAGFIAWILVGLIGGYLASRVVNKSGEGLLRDIILGIIGGIIGGFLWHYRADSLVLTMVRVLVTISQMH